MCEEEVAVFIVVVSLDVEGCELASALRAHTHRTRFLLAYHGLQVEFSKLQVRTDTEQGGGTRHERVVGWKRDVTCFNQFHDFVLLALVLQFQVLRVEVEGRIRVVVDVEVHLVAHLRVHREVDFLVEVETRHLAVALRQRWVVSELVVVAEFQFCRTLRLDLHATRTEYLFRWTQVEVHVREVELLLSLSYEERVIALTEIGLHALTLRPFQVLFRCHQVRCRKEVVAQFRTHAEHAQLLVPFAHFWLQVLGVCQVERIVFGTVAVRVVRFLHLSRQRVGRQQG